MVIFPSQLSVDAPVYLAARPFVQQLQLPLIFLSQPIFYNFLFHGNYRALVSSLILQSKAIVGKALNNPESEYRFSFIQTRNGNLLSFNKFIESPRWAGAQTKIRQDACGFLVRELESNSKF